jgi:hypothetical protein
MEESGFTWSPIYSGLVGGLVVFALVFFTNSESRRDGNVRLLEFGIIFKSFAILLVIVTLFILYAMVGSFEGQEVAATLVGLGFLAGSTFFSYQAFFIRFGYDDEFIYFKSPIAGDNKVPWDNFERVGYSWLLQADYIVVSEIGKIWCSNMLNGHSELMEYINTRARS